MTGKQTSHREAVLAQLAAERSRREELARIVRDILAEQPSPNTVRSAARRIGALVLHISDEVVEELGHRVAGTAS